MSAIEPIERSVVEAAVAGDASAVRVVVTRLAPVVRVAVARVLYRYRTKARGRDIAQEAEDLAQDAFVALFESGGRVLRSWDPARGASLETFVRVVAERCALATLRSGKRSPFTEDPTVDADLEEALGREAGVDDRVASHDLLVRMHDRLKENLSPRGYLLFRRMYVDEADVDVICEEFAMAKDAVYAWKHRFGKAVATAHAELGPSSRPGATKVEEAQP